MFRKHPGRRSPNILFVLFRMVLSMVMLGVLLLGIYSAYKQFSGIDPLKLDPQAVLSQLISKAPPGLLGILPFQISQKVLGQQSSLQIPAETPPQPADTQLILKFLLLADSHSDNTNLQKALEQAKKDYPGLEFIIGLGDYSEVGTTQELSRAKKELDSAGLRYFLIPGDHDLWDCRNRNLPPLSCFNQVFGPAYQAFTVSGFRFILLNNSDNYIGLGEEQSNWITDELQRAAEDKVKGILVFIHEPLYHPSSEHVMGRVEKNLKSQAKELMFELRQAGVKKVFSGDSHFFSQYSEPVTGLPMVTIGAVTIERNPQAPRFAVVSVFDDGTTRVEDVEIR